MATAVFSGATFTAAVVAVPTAKAPTTEGRSIERGRSGRAWRTGLATTPCVGHASAPRVASTYFTLSKDNRGVESNVSRIRMKCNGTEKKLTC